MKNRISRCLYSTKSGAFQICISVVLCLFFLRLNPILILSHSALAIVRRDSIKNSVKYWEEDIVRSHFKTVYIVSEMSLLQTNCLVPDHVILDTRVLSIAMISSSRVTWIFMNRHTLSKTR